MKFKNSILEAIGGTPLVKLNRVTTPDMADVLVKCEYMNPAGSIKDRMAFWILKRAEEEGLLKPGGTIVENTSGNTGMGAAMAAAANGYRAVFTMPDKMSREKIDGLRAFGAEVIITPTDVPGDSPDHYVNVAKRVAQETPGAFYMDQYHSQWNIEAHYKLTGPEIFEETDGGDVDAVVAGTGTGGTISGIGRYFKENNARAKIVGVDPLGSVHYHVFKTGVPSTPYVYKVEGLGEDIVCRAFDPSVVDEMMQVSDAECFYTARRLVKEEGLFCGGSSGGIVHGAMRVAKELGPGKTVVAVLPDSGGRYLSKYLSDDWMKLYGFGDDTRSEGLVEELITTNRATPITVSEDEALGRAIELMRENGVSQLPVTGATGTPTGMVHEIDVLRGMHGGGVDPAAPIKSVATELAGVVHPKARIEELFPIFDRDQVAVVVDSGRAVAVLSQIDLIDHLAGRGAAATATA
ncbi:MAG: pyridoxal-phosphate dependent enzyme [Planctomycetota bacterium]